MKYLCLLLCVLSSLSCKREVKDSIIGLEFNSYKEFKSLVTFTKVSDTSFYDMDTNPKYRLLHIKEANKHVVLFTDIIYSDNFSVSHYKLLDTLQVSNLNGEERFTIGYCELDLERRNKGNLIAVVETQDPKNMFIERVKQVWRANPESEQIEVLNRIPYIQCLNENYTGSGMIMDYGLLPNLDIQ